MRWSHPLQSSSLLIESKGGIFMALPDFKGHVFERTDGRSYRCLHCGLKASETPNSYDFSAPGRYASIDAIYEPDSDPFLPACVGSKSN